MEEQVINEEQVISEDDKDLETLMNTDPDEIFNAIKDADIRVVAALAADLKDLEEGVSNG